jgi:integrase
VENFKTEAAAWTKAKRIRDQFISDIRSGKVALPEVESVTCSELLSQYVAHLNTKKKPAAYVIEKCVEATIRPFFGTIRVPKLETRHFEQYREMRSKTVSNATVDHDFTCLKSALMFECKKAPSRIVKVPHIPKSGEDKVRSGFLEFEGYEKVLAKLPMSLKCIFVVAYYIGNRKGALLELKWPQVDFTTGWFDSSGCRIVSRYLWQRRFYGDMGQWLIRQTEFRDQHFPKCQFVFLLVSRRLRDQSNAQERARWAPERARYGHQELL